MNFIFRNFYGILSDRQLQTLESCDFMKFIVCSRIFKLLVIFIAAKQNKPYTESSSDTSKMAERRANRDEYGRPVAGSLTEMRGQKANIHISKEIVQLCEIIDAEGMQISEENPGLKGICFGDLFSLYTHISNKLVGVLMRARKHKLIDFEGEMLFQRRDDEVPIYMLKTLAEIRAELKEQQDEVQNQMCEAPKPTNVLLNK